jgi:hypothetical protein
VQRTKGEPAKGWHGSTEEADTDWSPFFRPIAAPTTKPKGTSPSPNIQRAAKDSWDSWHKMEEDPKAALADNHTENPVKVGGSKK